jgi:hypothetical protein
MVSRSIIEPRSALLQKLGPARWVASKALFMSGQAEGSIPERLKADAHRGLATSKHKPTRAPLKQQGGHAQFGREVVGGHPNTGNIRPQTRIQESLTPRGRNSRNVRPEQPHTST